MGNVKKPFSEAFYLLGYKHREDEKPHKWGCMSAQSMPPQGNDAQADAKITHPSNLREFRNHQSQLGLKQVKKITSPIIFASLSPGGLFPNQTFLSCWFFPQLHWFSAKESKNHHSLFADASKRQRMESPAGDISGEDAFSSLCSSFVKCHVKEVQVRIPLRVLHQGGGFACTWTTEESTKENEASGTRNEWIHAFLIGFTFPLLLSQLHSRIILS